MRARIDISEVEARTKIRAKYLRAIENEEWDLLPGPVYAKSFLRTYGDFLGLDSRMLLDELALMRRLAEGAARGAAFEWISHRDPVCGMAVAAAQQTVTLDGLTMQFCSEQCRSKFAAAPGLYLPSMTAVPSLPRAGPAALPQQHA